MFKKELLALVGAFAFSAMTALAQGVMTFDKTEHNFGKFPEEKPQTYTFKFKNTGDRPFVIKQAFASCGCTIPSYSQEPVAPGKRGEIKVVVQRTRQIRRRIHQGDHVRSDASNETVRLYIKGDMQAAKDPNAGKYPTTPVPGSRLSHSLLPGMYRFHTLLPPLSPCLPTSTSSSWPAASAVVSGP